MNRAGNRYDALSRKEKAKVTPITPTPGSGAPKTKDQPLFGLWEDREDISDPAPSCAFPAGLPPQTTIKKQLRVGKSKMIFDTDVLIWHARANTVVGAAGHMSRPMLERYSHVRMTAKEKPWTP